MIQRLVVDTTYLYGIKTLALFATSKDIEELIVLTSSSVLKPLFWKDNTLSNVITTQYDKRNADYFIDFNHVSTTTHTILEQCNIKLKANVEEEFTSFCNDFVQDCETLQLIDETFKNIQDADMMVQCNELLYEYIGEVIMFE